MLEWKALPSSRSTSPPPADVDELSSGAGWDLTGLLPEDLPATPEGMCLRGEA